MWIKTRSYLAPIALGGVVFLLSFNLVMRWLPKELNVVTGDEPHYLMISKAILGGLLFQQSEIYANMPRISELFPNGLSSDDWHLVTGPNGRFSFHGLGLPFLLTPAFALFGIVGAKTMTCAMAGMIPILLWYLSGSFVVGPLRRFLAVLGVSICPSILAGGTQIYPDLPAGMLALVGVNLLCRSTEPTFRVVLFGALALAYLPWLQVKFALLSFCLLFGWAIKIWFKSKSLRFPIAIVSVGLISMVLLVAYNKTAYGRLAGPYGANDIEVSLRSLMVFWGLILDQNQGFLLQNPIHFFGVFYLGSFFRERTYLAVILILVCTTLLVPSSLHPNWYGGGSFSGRFEWPTSLVFSAVTLYGMLRLSVSRPTIFLMSVVMNLILQAMFYMNYLSGKISLYNRGIETPATDYAIFYPWVSNDLPMFFNVSWAYHYFPNYAWLIGVMVLFLLGLGSSSSTPR